MLKKTITYTDYNGTERVEDHWFNISKAEAFEIQAEYNGDFSEMINRLISEHDMKKIMEIFKTFVLKAYGVKSLDGKRFIKSQELRDEFSQTEAYVTLFMELAGDANAAAEFVTGVMPSKMDAESVPKKSNALPPAK